MTGILLINLGTPDQPTTSSVRKYLRQFLSDPRVIDIHPILRQLLLNLIILPFRSSKSAEAYRKIWTEEGSPLLFHTKNLGREVAARLGGNYSVEIAMRYGNPSIASALQKLIEKNISEIRVLPLFPQYAVSSTGSAIAEVYRVCERFWHIPPIRILPAFYDHPGFIKSFAQVGRPILNRIQPDHVLLSFHGLPERQVIKTDLSHHCLRSEGCCHEISPKNQFCYRAQCFKTAHLIAQELGLNENQYSISFQSRLGRTPWIKPYTDQTIIELAKKGKKRIAVFCPAFVADCLETLEEIGIRGRQSALDHGAEVFELVPSLNTSPMWIQTLCELVTPAILP